MENENKQPTFPYVPYPAFKAFIGHLHDTVVTDQIDNTMMPHKMSGGAKYAMTSALKALGFIDEQNNTTPKLKELVKAYNNSKEWATVIQKYILSAYSDITGSFDLKSATRKQVDGMFKDTSPQMRDKYIRFFLSANKDAGIEYSPYLKIRRRLPKKRTDTGPKKGEISDKKRTKPKDETLKNEKTPPNMFDLPIPIATGSFIRVPSNTTVNQVAVIRAAVDYLEAMAKQNKESEK